MESMSGKGCLAEAGDSRGEEYDALELLDSCGWLLDEPPPKTRLKNPGFSLGTAAGVCDGKRDLRVLILGLGADDGSCNDGTGGRSRRVLALTNSCAWALMLGSSWLLFLRSVL
jgi:hypothetical protein